MELDPALAAAVALPVCRAQVLRVRPALWERREVCPGQWELRARQGTRQTTSWQVRMEMTAKSVESLNPAAERRRRRGVFSRRLRLGMVLVVLYFTIIGSVALVLAADHFLFMRGTCDSWRLSFAFPNHEDLAWWQARVGPLPPAGTTEGLVGPARPVGPDGWNRDPWGSPYTARLPDGLVAYRMNTSWPMIRGDLLTSKTTHAWRAGVDLPGGMVLERSYISPPGQAPPHPTLGGWKWRVLPLGLVLNTLYAAGPVCIVVTLLAWEAAGVYRRIRGTRRRARGQCPDCGYAKGPTPGDECPECGYAWR